MDNLNKIIQFNKKKIKYPFVSVVDEKEIKQLEEDQIQYLLWHDILGIRLRKFDTQFFKDRISADTGGKFVLNLPKTIGRDFVVSSNLPYDDEADILGYKSIFKVFKELYSEKTYQDLKMVLSLRIRSLNKNPKFKEDIKNAKFFDYFCDKTALYKMLLDYLKNQGQKLIDDKYSKKMYNETEETVKTEHLKKLYLFFYGHETITQLRLAF